MNTFDEKRLLCSHLCERISAGLCRIAAFSSARAVRLSVSAASLESNQLFGSRENIGKLISFQWIVRVCFARSALYFRRSIFPRIQFSFVPRQFIDFANTLSSEARPKLSRFIVKSSVALPLLRFFRFALRIGRAFCVFPWIAVINLNESIPFQ